MSDKSASVDQGFGQDGEQVGKTVGLPVIEGDGGGSSGGSRCGSGKAPGMGQSKKARWRTFALVMVNVFMVVHLIQWLIMGMTISPVEPSEAMETLEVGVVNAGAVFFLVAILATAFFGRFFCGWLCHMVALQDLCAVAMARIGIRPKPFRSRLLMWIPVVLGMYMFVWPTFKRLVMKPVFEKMSIDWPVWLQPVNEIHEFTTEFIVSDYWATMPPWEVAVVFLFVCGFVCVYFLGAKGFCTYACPYAGFFKPIDKIAPVRIVVNDDCRGCGHCTSVCTSNVRVSEEVRDFGMVIDNGCMKTLDCVSACPNDALSIGFGGPAILKKAKDTPAARMAAEKRKRRYDLNVWEDVAALVVFAWAFYATRGAFDRVPMLMAGGMAAVVTMLVVQLYWLVRREHVRLHSLQLKKAGKIKLAGWVAVVLTVGMLGLGAWTSHTKYVRWRGDLMYASFDAPSDVMLRNDFLATPEMELRAREALGWLKKGDSFERGGYGWTLNAEYRVMLAYLYTLVGEHREAVDQLQLVIDEGNPTDSLILQSGRIAQMAEIDDRGGIPALLSKYENALEAHPDLHLIRSELAKAAWSRQNREEAEAMWEHEPEENEIGFLMARAGFEGFRGEIDAVRALYEEAIFLVPEQEGSQAGWYIDIARGASAFRMNDIMDGMAIAAIESEDATARTWLSAGELANALRQMEVSVARAEKALTMPGNTRSMVLQRAAGILADGLTEGAAERAMNLLTRAHERAETDFDRKYIIEKMIRVGVFKNSPEATETSVALYEALAEERSDLPVIMKDYAELLLQIGRGEAGVEAMERAAGFDERNAVIAQRVSGVYSLMGNAEKAQEWVDESERRRAEFGG